MGYKKKTTIKDIANVLGITPSAVSKALNNHPRISKKTKEAVLQVAENLNYQPNHIATALRKGKSNLVGVIIPKANSNFFSSVIETIEAILNKKGYNVIITQSNESYVKECKNIEALLFTQVDGIIASMANETVKLDYYNKIKQKGIPLILFDRGENDLNVDYVGIDDYMSSHIVIDHLVEQGCKRIAHISGFSHTRIYKNRIRGYLDALNKYNLPFEENLIYECNLRQSDGRELMKKILKLPNRPDGIYVSGDYAALGALEVMKENNINVPEDIALVGFSNEPFSAIATPSISSVEQHSERIGELAAKTFLKRIKNPQEEVSLNKMILDAELIVRASSKRK
ncbi:LacI family DNA-binding transcriptional regulator [Hyunsoonleella pacifica]|uniref:LacI family transcriptional regulator n=1 Tax=Hyunsoonleella pacifica TaxID=1080224 RepID=A0A4V2JAP5_9FLAO|nr:LacI family DNA-binding transcriptional regulator [Hyunsoonleella pacifica]TBN13900.1 LacI family transcriptional regulator [Hyunsoonleella pacifica]GGD26660.1 LacI family transcriptional regulator [Hyunsoonleella pacifica]